MHTESDNRQRVFIVRQGVGVLGREIHDYVSNKYVHNIVEIDDSPCDVLVHGVPIRGHFNVIFKF